ncbi:hypothetical protein [Rhizobium leguminosarum]|uniref:hypothetical protein n=1 Tax=Rhizobium leguminosarum TaxID=384 RepID=UPI003F9B4B4D
MAAKPSSKAEAWEIFDHIVASAAPGGKHSNPWVLGSDSQPSFRPDYKTLALLLGVPLHLKVGTQTGVPALALDVWLSYELRRAGFGTDQVWPRPVNPRVLPVPVAAFVKSLPIAIRAKAQTHLISNTSIPSVTSSSASILGKNYLKQVDVIITDWVTGPELLISTKRMDSSYGKNAPNRIEESYGDAKNLRLRHPLAALGFLFGLRSDILEKEPKTAEWLFDLLSKLGREDDAYHSTCLVLMEYSTDPILPTTDEEEPSDGILEPGPQPITDPADDEIAHLAESTVESIVKALPKVSILEERTPDDLSPARFLTSLITRVLATTPVNMHEEARRRRASVLPRK